MSETGVNVIVIIIVFLFLVLSVFIRSRRAGGAPLGIAIGMLSDVSKNEKLVENFSFHRTIGRFKAGSWKKNKGKIDFLPQELRMTLAQVSNS